MIDMMEPNKDGPFHEGAITRLTADHQWLTTDPVQARILPHLSFSVRA